MSIKPFDDRVRELIDTRLFELGITLAAAKGPSFLYVTDGDAWINLGEIEDCRKESFRTKHPLNKDQKLAARIAQWAEGKTVLMYRVDNERSHAGAIKYWCFGVERLNVEFMS